MSHRITAGLRGICVLVTLSLLAACGRGLPGGIDKSIAPLPPARSVESPAGVSAEITADRIVLRNALVERAWTRSPYITESFTDLRNGRVWTAGSPDFALTLAAGSTAAALDIGSNLFSVSGEPVAEVTPKGAVRITLTLAPTPLASLPAGFSMRRVVEMYPGVAGVRQETSVNSLVPLAITGYTVDELRPAGDGLAAEAHSFRAGADWREPEWAGPVLNVGDAQTGDWRKTTSGAEVAVTAQWLAVSDASGARAFQVLERNDQASSVMSFTNGRARARVDLSRDVIYLGPLEEQLHVGNPGSGPGRVRVILPGTPFRLEPVFTGLALDADDEPWQHYKYLDGFRMAPYRREVTFNSNGVDDNVISTGAKDDLDYAQFLVQLETAKKMGVELFIFDDGWQGRSGDWCPDSDVPEESCHDPRRGTAEGYPPRFPDAEFKAVREQLDPLGIKLGLWMSPLHFHPTAAIFDRNPQWACLPLSVGLLALNTAQPYDSSSEAGIVQWNPEATGPDGKAIDYIESRIRIAIEQWGVQYFKFDFTAWLDCVGVYSVDLYTYRESFMAMLDRVLADHPTVTIQMDETNDYRLWPFEAIARGPTWYQNGSPTPNDALHTNHVLAPYIPLFALGRNGVRLGDLENFSPDYQMAVALLSHMTFFNDLRQLPESLIPVIRKWVDYYKAHRTDLAQFAYPLLDEDPFSGDNWAAFQTWNPETARGALLVYRQDAAEDRRTIRLRNVPDGQYRLLEAPEEKTVLEFSAQQLREGIEIAVPAQRSARVLRIERKS